MALVVAFDNLLSDTCGLLVAALRVAWEKYDGKADGFPDIAVYAILDAAVVIDDEVIRQCCHLVANNKTMTADSEGKRCDEAVSWHQEAEQARVQKEEWEVPVAGMGPPLLAGGLCETARPPAPLSGPVGGISRLMFSCCSTVSRQPATGVPTEPEGSAGQSAEIVEADQTVAHEINPAWPLGVAGARMADQAIYATVRYIMNMCARVIKPRPAALEWLVDCTSRRRHATESGQLQSALIIAATGNVTRAQTAVRAWIASMQAGRQGDAPTLERVGPQLEDAVSILSSLRLCEWNDLIEDDPTLEATQPKRSMHSTGLRRPPASLQAKRARPRDLAEIFKGTEGMPACFVLRQPPDVSGLAGEMVETYDTLPEPFPDGAVPRNKPPTKVKTMNRALRHSLTQLAWRACMPIELPLLRGKVVHGFKRGSTALGVPTANLDCRVSFGFNHQCPIPGVYFGWCGVNYKSVSQMLFGCVANVGYVPFYGNVHPSLEVHVFYEFGFEFYGADVVLDIKALIRPEAKFPSFLELVDAIQADCEAADFLWRSVPVVAVDAACGDLPYPPSSSIVDVIREWASPQAMVNDTEPMNRNLVGSLHVVQVRDPDGNLRSTVHQHPG